MTAWWASREAMLGCVLIQIIRQPWLEFIQYRMPGGRIDARVPQCLLRPADIGLRDLAGAAGDQRGARHPWG